MRLQRLVKIHELSKLHDTIFLGGTLLANDPPNRELKPLLGDKKMGEEGKPFTDGWKIPGSIDSECNPNCCIAMAGEGCRSIKNDLTDSSTPKGESLPNGVRRIAQVGAAGFFGLVIWGMTFNLMDGNN